MKLGVKINHDIVRRSSFLRNLHRWFSQRSLLGYLVNRFQWHWYPRLFKVRNYPIHVDIELSSRCNLKCPMCFREHREIPKQNNMSLEMFKRIIDEIDSNVYSIKFTGRGEPQMNKDFPEYLRYLKGKRFGEIAMITNGQLMTDDKIDAIIDCGMDFITFSVDGLKETYEEIRKPGKYEDIIEVVGRLHRRREELGSNKPLIRIQSVMIPTDQQQEFLRIWEPISDDILFLHFKDYSAEADNIQKQDYPCPLVIQRLMIHFDGTVPMCINDEYEMSPLGDLARQSVHEVWHGNKFTNARRVHREGRRTECYENCAHCPLTREGHGEG